MRWFGLLTAALCCPCLLFAQRVPAADTTATISGELRQWHNVTLTFTGPEARETHDRPNPFLDYRLTVTFTHESGALAYRVPGYFAADGDAANSSAAAGSKWRAMLRPISREGGPIACRSCKDHRSP